MPGLPCYCARKEIEVMRGLLILPPYIDLILEDRKSWEMRNSRCNFREQIALIRSKTQTIVGVAHIVDCIGPLTDIERLETNPRHCVDPSTWLNPQFANYRFAWVLSNVHRLLRPVPYNHPKGAVKWVTLDQSVEHSVTSELMRSR